MGQGTSTIESPVRRPLIARRTSPVAARSAAGRIPLCGQQHLSPLAGSPARFPAPSHRNPARGFSFRSSMALSFASASLSTPHNEVAG